MSCRLWNSTPMLLKSDKAQDICNNFHTRLFVGASFPTMSKGIAFGWGTTMPATEIFIWPRTRCILSAPWTQLEIWTTPQPPAEPHQMPINEFSWQLMLLASPDIVLHFITAFIILISVSCASLCAQFSASSQRIYGNSLPVFSFRPIDS